MGGRDGEKTVFKGVESLVDYCIYCVDDVVDEGLVGRLAWVDCRGLSMQESHEWSVGEVVGQQCICLFVWFLHLQ